MSEAELGGRIGGLQKANAQLKSELKKAREENEELKLQLAQVPEVVAQAETKGARSAFEMLTDMTGEWNIEYRMQLWRSHHKTELKS